MWLPDWLRHAMAPTPGRWQGAARFTLSACAVISIGQMLRLPNYYWGLITVCVLVLPTAGAVLAKSLFRMVGTLLAAVISVGLVGGFIQHHVLYTLALVVVNAVLIYYATGKFAPYTFLICAMTIAVITFSVIDAPINVEWKAPTRALEVAIGILVVGFFTLTAWPHFAQDELRGRFALSIRTLGDLHDLTWKHLREAKKGLAAFEEALEPTRGGLGKRAALLEDAVWEDPGIENRRRHIESQNYHLSRLYALIYQARHLLAQPPTRGLLQETSTETQRLVDALAAGLRQLADEVQARRTGRLLPDLAPAVKALEARMADPDLRRRSMDFTTAENMQTVAYLNALLETADLLATLRDEYQRQCRKTTGSMWLPVRRILQGLWAETLALDTRQLRHALAGAGAVAFIFILGRSGYLGSSTLAAVAALIVVTWPTVGGGVSKGLLAFLGVCLGSLASFLMSGLVLPYTHSLGTLLLGVAPFFFFVGWLLAGSPLVAFLGMFTGIIFVVNGFRGFAPPPDISGYSLTIIGILAGALIGIALQLGFLSTPAHRVVLDSLAGFLRSTHQRLTRLHRLDEQPPPPNPSAAMAATQRDLTLLASIGSANAEARFELERNAIAKGKIATLQQELEQLLLALISLEHLSYQELDAAALAFSRPPGIALKTQCLDLLDALARYTSSDGKIAPSPDRLDQLATTQRELENTLHAFRAHRHEHHIGQRAFTNALGYLERLSELATLLQTITATLHSCFGRPGSASVPMAASSTA